MVDERKVVSNPFNFLDIGVVSNEQDTGLVGGSEAPEEDD